LGRLKRSYWADNPRSFIKDQKEFKIRRMIMNIYVGNLSHNVTEENIRQEFEAFGQVSLARIVKDKYNGQPRGFGFVEMPGQVQAQTAIKSLNGKELLGKQINVNEARPRTDQGRFGGQGGHREGTGYGGRSRY
jgi:RNA recognition motif-containing protein